MSSKSNKNEEYFQTILQNYSIDIIEARTFEKIADLIISAIEDAIDPFFNIVGQVKDGTIKGIVRHKGGLDGPLSGDGLPLDGPGVIVRSINTKKIINLPDTRQDPDVLPVEVTSDSFTLSEIAVPILAQGKSIGIINIEETETNAFDEYDQKFLEDLSRYAGVSLSNIIYSNRLNGLHKHTSQLSTSTNLVDVAEQTLQAMTETLELETCTFLLSDDGVFSKISEKGLDKSIQLRKKSLQGLARAGDYSDKDMILARTDRFRKADDIEFISELETPVIINDEVVAILSAKSIRPDNYTDQDKQLLEILASHVASAIQRIRLQEEQIQYEAKLTALHDSASRLVYSDSQEDIWRVTNKISRDLFDYEYVSLGFVQDNQIRYLYSPGDEENPTLLDPDEELAVLFFDLSRDNTVITRAVKTGEIQDVPDTSLDPDFVCTVFDDDGEPVLKSEYTIPIIQSGKVVAILNAESEKLNAFSEQDKKLLETLASNISAALMRLKVTEELVLERVRVEQAHELDRMKNQFISTATHELRTPVTSIIGFLELVLDYSSEELPDTVRNDLNVVFRNAMRLVHMTNDLLDVQRINSGRFEVTLNQIDLRKTLVDVLEELSPLFTEKQQTLLVDSPNEIVVNVDETRISQLFINLIRNANKFTPEKGTIEITVKPIDSYVQFTVKDSGIGLSEEDISKLFKPFPSIQHEINVSSTGLGLAICKGIVDLHNGEIWAESEGKGMGSTFSAKIPINS
jgi:signal transduction histidine kinase